MNFTWLAAPSPIGLLTAMGDLSGVWATFGALEILMGLPSNVLPTLLTAPAPGMSAVSVVTLGWVVGAPRVLSE